MAKKPTKPKEAKTMDMKQEIPSTEASTVESRILVLRDLVHEKMQAEPYNHQYARAVTALTEAADWMILDARRKAEKVKAAIAAIPAVAVPSMPADVSEKTPDIFSND